MKKEQKKTTQPKEKILFVRRPTPNSILLHSYALHRIDVEVYSRIKGISDQEAVNALVRMRIDGKDICPPGDMTPRSIAARNFFEEFEL